jgi:hypothetical protein
VGRANSLPVCWLSTNRSSGAKTLVVSTWRRRASLAPLPTRLSPRVPLCRALGGVTTALQLLLLEDVGGPTHTPLAFALDLLRGREAGGARGSRGTGNPALLTMALLTMFIIKI